MDLMRIQTLLTMRFRDDHARRARMAHFMGLLKTGLDGMATLGVVMRVEVDGLMESSSPPPPPPPDPLTSLDLAIAHMVRATTHATHEERSEDQDGHDEGVWGGEGREGILRL